MSTATRRLLIVSHTPHYLWEGKIVGWGATVREIDELAKLFESIVHVAPLHPGPAPGTSMAYRSPRVALRPVRPSGGRHWYQALGILGRYPGYARTILREMSAADVVHVRAPANISLLALVLLGLRSQPKVRWAKYAGDWSGGQGEPWSYWFQRAWLAGRWHRGVVTVNGEWAGQPEHIHSFVNPCLAPEELQAGAVASRAKALSAPVRLLFVGRVETAKGAGVSVEIAAGLKQAGLSPVLDVVGDGEERPGFERLGQKLGLNGELKFHGALRRPDINPLYERAHFLLLPSHCSEGWPKVLSEGMAYGVVPLASAVSSIPQFLHRFSTGSALASRRPQDFVALVREYALQPERWRRESENAVRAAQAFSYENYLMAVKRLLELPMN